MSKMSSEVVPSNTANFDATTPDFWFGMAKWAKDTNQFNGFVRRFIFNVGVLKSTGKTLSDKQLVWANKLLTDSAELGFVASPVVSDEISNE